MKYSRALAAVVLLVLPGSAIGQDISGVVTLGFGDSNADSSSDFTTQSAEGRIGFKFSSGFSINVKGHHVNGNADVSSEDFSGTLFGVDAAYHMPSGLGVGAYAEDAKLDIAGLGDLSGTSYGVTVGYETQGVSYDLFVGQTNPDDLPGVDGTDYGLAVLMDGGERTILGGSIQRSKFSGSGVDATVDSIGLGGGYEITDQWTVFGAVNWSSLDDTDLVTYGLGVSYDLTSLFDFGSVVSVEIARSNVDGPGVDDSIDTVRLGFTIPFGASPTKIPVNSVTDAVLYPSHSAIGSSLLAAF